MSKELTFSSALALCSASALLLQVETASASPVPPATLTSITEVKDPYPNPLTLTAPAINSPALYNVRIFNSEDSESQIPKGPQEYSPAGGPDYTGYFELVDYSLSFNAGTPPADGILFPHYLVISYFIDYEDPGSEDENNVDEFTVATLEIPEPDQPLGSLYEIVGCNPGPCTIDLLQTLLGENLEGGTLRALNVSVYNSAVIPLPPAALLFGSALAAVAFGSRRRKAKA